MPNETTICIATIQTYDICHKKLATLASCNVFQTLSQLQCNNICFWWNVLKYEIIEWNLTRVCRLMLHYLL